MRLILIAGLAQLMLAGASAADVVPVWISNGNGFIVSGPEGCVIVTAAHVVEATPEFEYLGPHGLRHARVKWSSDPDVDAAIAKPVEGESECPPLPTRKQIEDAIEQRSFNIVMLTESGGESDMLVQLTDRRPLDPNPSDFGIAPIKSSDSISQGMSGSVVTSNGLAIALVRSDSGPAGKTNSNVLRLDYLATMTQAREFLTLPQPSNPADEMPIATEDEWTRIDRIGAFHLGQWAALISGFSYPKEPNDDPGLRPWRDEFFFLKRSIELGDFTPSTAPMKRADRMTLIRRDELTEFYRKQSCHPRALFPADGVPSCLAAH